MRHRDMRDAARAEEELSRVKVRSMNWSTSTNRPGVELALKEPQAESDTMSVTPARFSASMLAR